MTKWHYHVISNTHWDREWRYPFQVYRMELVFMMDELIDLLEKRREYRAFFLDSQTLILEDYLEIRPENEERIKRLVQEDRLQIGPWYTLPDEWGCPGEALVRNLLMGYRVGRRFGPISKLGYTPFSNGQISQLPQLYQGFGIDSCFFYRGVGKHVAPPEFIWQSPDGSQIFSFRFGDFARYNYYFLVYRPGLLGRFPEHREYKWNPREIPFHVASDTFQDRQYAWMNQQLQVHEENLERALEDARKYTRPDTATHHLLYMMGHDHSFATEKELDLIEACQKHLDPQEESLIHSSLNDYMEAFRKEAGDLPVLKGEMRYVNKEGLWTNLFAEILSSRLYLKQENARVNDMVMYGSEPLAALAWLSGFEYPGAFFEVAWKKILINQAHDAIGGCSVDPVHREMQARWSEVKALSDEISRNAMKDIASRIDGSGIEKSNLQLTVFNTLPYNRTGVGEFIIDIPTDDDKIAFAIQNSKGDPVPFQVLSRQSYTPTIEGGYELPMPFSVQRFRTILFLEDFPGMGYEALAVIPGKSIEPEGASLVESDLELENEHLKVYVKPNGTLKLADKKSGRVMDDLCFLEDEAEFGDPWNRIVPGEAQPYTSLESKAKTRILHDGPLQGSLEVRFSFCIPAEKDEGDKRSDVMVDIPVRMVVTLKKGSPMLDIAVTIDNRARDHRLRVCFPSDLSKAMHSFAEGQFDVLTRPIKLPDSLGWKEAPYPTHPMWNFVDVSDGENGLAVMNDGLIEYEVKDDARRTIVLTLIRAYGKFVFDRPTPEAQCLGKHTYRFALRPHEGLWSDTNLFLEKQDWLVPYQAVESAPTRGELPPGRSFLHLEPGELVFSAIKQSEDGKSLVVRVWNPKDRSQDMTLETGFPLKGAKRLTLEEEVIEEIDLKNSNIIKMPIAKKKIETVGLYF